MRSFFGRTSSNREREASTPVFPARAGQPRTMRLGGRRVEGLSPLARGNQILRHCWTLWLGPIPARAGQPRPCRIRRPWCWAYPRSRGATFASVGGMDKMKGLSPLARGNQGRCMGRPAYQGPIPARAGQPYRTAACSGSSGAYPRSRGATSPAPLSCSVYQGLSPLARGNRGECVALHV